MRNSLLTQLFLLLFLTTLDSVCHAQISSAVERSVREWVACDGVSDDRDGFARAINAASADRFVLTVDCVVNIKIGEDIGKPIFLADNLTVRFLPGGKVVVDNIFVPAFVLANLNNVSLLDWVVEFRGRLSVDPYRNGYYHNGIFVRFPYDARPAYAFNDVVLKSWLIEKKGVEFENTNPWWTGPTATMAIFHVRGNTAGIKIKGGRVGVAPNKAGHEFVPVAFAFIPGPKTGVRVSDVTPYDASHYAVPHDLYISDVVLDGVYMGFLGSVRDAIFSGVRSVRYGDLQDEAGRTVGGVGKWFPPPHLFYLHSDSNKDPTLQNGNIKLLQIRDEGVRVGVARDRSANEARSGYANSLKIGGVDVLVDRYYSARPDGVLDLLPSQRLTIRNLTGSYSSSFLNNLYPGIRFPAVGYKDVLMTGIRVSDVSNKPVMVAPIGSMAGGESVTIESARFGLPSWGGATASLQQAAHSFRGQDNRVVFTFHVGSSVGQSKLIRSGLVRDLGWYMSAEPSINHVGAITHLRWGVSGVDSCFAGAGSWNVSGLSGDSDVSSDTDGYFTYGLSCHASGGFVVSPAIGVSFFKNTARN